jgi:hypothetical protein
VRIIVALLLLTITAASRGVAGEIYVDNLVGDDVHSGRHAALLGEVDGPLRTIGRALAIARKRDRIVLINTGEPYRESISLSAGNHSGVPDEWFVLEGNGAVLDGTAPVDPRAWEYAGIKGVFRFQPPRMAHQQLYLTGAPLVRVKVDRHADAMPALAPLEWCLWRGQVYFRVEEGRWIADYDLWHTYLPVGITLYQVRNVAVTNLVVQGFQLDGINAHDAHGCTLHAITSRGNGRSGITVAASSRVSIDGSLLGDNGEAQLLTEGYSITEVRDSELLANTAPAVVRLGGKVSIVAPVETPAAEPAPPQDQPPSEETQP